MFHYLGQETAVVMLFLDYDRFDAVINFPSDLPQEHLFSHLRGSERQNQAELLVEMC